MTPDYLDIHRRTAGAAWATLAVSVAAIGGAVCVPKEYRLPFLGVAGTAAATSKALGSTVRDIRFVIETDRQSQRLNRQVEGLTGSSLSADSSSKPTAKLFNWADLADKPDKYPHMLLLGNTGAGKSTLAEFLGIKLQLGKRYVVAPHRKPGEWQGFDGVYAGGRNYGSTDDPRLTWAEVTASQTATAYQVLRAISAEMSRRYTLRDQGIEEWEFIDLYLDEVPALAANVPHWASMVPSLIMEARKVGIRLWFLTQGDLVKMLGMEGKSALRQSLTYIYLGEFASDRKDELVKAGKLKGAELDHLEKADRPCIVNETVADLPHVSDMKAYIASKVQPTAARPQPVKAAAEGPGSPAFAKHEDLLNQAIELLDQGLSKDQIIFGAWGYHGAEIEVGRKMWRDYGLPG